MIVLDAYALTALLAEEPAASEVGELIAGAGAAVTVPNLAEAADRLARVHRIAVERTRAAVETLEQSTDLCVRPAERPDAWRAAELRTEHYHRTRCPLSLGDCLLLAMTGAGEQVATADPHVLNVAGAEGIEWIALPDSRGHRHAPGRHS
ncbi:MAG TPA: PIN domain-containing protein [Solirubrobacteraceae bacterium]|nr:PIN domain-containing protein [Solirubrobacteraceae bacterium]